MRTTCNENLSTSFSALGYEESFTFVDTKLVVGYSCAAIAGLLYFYDKKYGFEKTYNLTILCLVIYFILSLFYYYLTNTDKYANVNYIGYDKGNSKVLVATWTTKYDPVYYMRIRFNEDKNNEITTNIEFMKLFDKAGYYHPQEMTNFVKTTLENSNKKNI